MPLPAGTRIGPYEVVGSLGAGGMGEVYRARDARLGRDVALKILPGAWASDPDRLARFAREAQVLASLNHPNIAALYGLEQGAQGQALVLELVEGETLEARLRRGPVPPDDAMAVALQIAAALEAAHERGIIHRDLKPANVKLTPDGTVKVLDFGLAKLAGIEIESPATAGPSALSLSPTVTSPAAVTHAGVLLGTAAYMSPEQARGRVVDRRADVWAFGCVLFEMLAGRRPFEGGDVTEQLASVIRGEPDWDRLPAATPARVRTVLRNCLQKDPSARMRDCGDLRLALQGAFESPAPGTAAAARRPALAWLALIAVAGALAMAVPFVLRTPPDPPLPERVQFDVAPPAGVRLSTYFALSPDGRHLAYTAGGADRQIGLWVHTFATGRSRQLDAAGVMDSRMFWSPDSDAIGYSRLGRLEKVDLAGGPAETLVSELLGFGGASWSHGGTIVYAAQEGLFKVPATGGAPTPLTVVDASRGETTHSAPWFLPDGRHFLYLRTSTDAATTGAYIGSIDSTPQAQPVDRLLAAAHDVRYVSSRPDVPGHLVFVRDDTAMAVPFDPGSRRMLGDASPIAPGVGSDGTYPFTSVSAAGSVAIRIGGAAGGGKPLWVDRTGQTLAEMAPSLTDATFPRISPDGTRVAVVTGGDIWVYHVDGRPPVRVTFEGSVYSPLWTPDGERIVYETSGGLLALTFADGRGGSAEQPFPPGHHHPLAWSPDGRRLITSSFGVPKTGVDIVEMEMGTTGVRSLVATPAGDGPGGGALSPDGRWLAYASTVTGTAEIWVIPYGTPGAAVRVSPAGGGEPLWAPDGRELYYIEGPRLMAVAVDTQDGFHAGVPRTLFDGLVRDSQPPSYAVAPDGRFLIKRVEGAPPPPPITVVLNALASGERGNTP